jgi:hypothetical protein
MSCRWTGCGRRWGRAGEPAAAEAQALDLQAGLVDYLKTTFALADSDAQVALEDFLQHGSDGIFKMPYVRLRLPFRPAESGWDEHLEWTPEGFVPYGHQAAAFAADHNAAECCTCPTTGPGHARG